MSHYVGANMALVNALSLDSDLTFKYERSIIDRATTHKVIVGEVMHAAAPGYPVTEFKIKATYGFNTAKVANAFLYGFAVMKDIGDGINIIDGIDPHYVRRLD